MGNGADDRLTDRVKVAEAKAKGYQGFPCEECQNFTIAKHGDMEKCDACGTIQGEKKNEDDATSGGLDVEDIVLLDGLD